MKIVFKDTFLNRFENQVDYIAQDSVPRAKRFKNNIMKRVKEIPKNPFQYRKSIYFTSDHIRDLIYKGYTIVFRITKTQIEVFGFVKYQNTPTD